MRNTKYRQMISKLLLISFCCLLPVTAFAQTVNDKKLTAREIAKQTLPSVVLLVMGNSKAETAKSGSGFFVTEDIVATNFHVIKDTDEGVAKIIGQDKLYDVLGVVGVDEKNDLALLKIKGIKGKPLILNKEDSTAIGDEVFAVGNPKGLEGTFSQGIISSIRKSEKINLLQITASISEGSSGGAILNNKGEVVGVAVGAIESGQSLNFAIPVSLLRSLISNKKSLKSLATYKAIERNIRKNSIGMELIYIPSGEFMMGSSEDEISIAVYEKKKHYSDASRDSFANETPRHKVTIKEGFWIGKYEVTQGQWEAVMGTTVQQQRDIAESLNKFPGVLRGEGANYPIYFVSWDDAQEFVRRLNMKKDGFEYHLPSEAQWEYAARAGTTTIFAFGNSLNSTQANFVGEYPFASTKGGKIGKTTPVGSYQPNAWGLYDMHGNVAEWCEDFDTNDYQESPTDGSANVRKDILTSRLLRDCGWWDYGVDCRSAERNSFLSNYRNNNVGFRLVALLKQ